MTTETWGEGPGTKALEDVRALTKIEQPYKSLEQFLNLQDWKRGLDAWQIERMKDYFRFSQGDWPTRDSAAPQEDC